MDERRSDLRGSINVSNIITRKCLAKVVALPDDAGGQAPESQRPLGARVVLRLEDELFGVRCIGADLDRSTETRHIPLQQTMAAAMIEET